jgi:hypothetical protein
VTWGGGSTSCSLPARSPARSSYFHLTQCIHRMVSESQPNHRIVNLLFQFTNSKKVIQAVHATSTPLLIQTTEGLAARTLRVGSCCLLPGVREVIRQNGDRVDSPPEGGLEHVLVTYSRAYGPTSHLMDTRCTPKTLIQDVHPRSTPCMVHTTESLGSTPASCGTLLSTVWQYRQQKASFVLPLEWRRGELTPHGSP